MKNLMWLPVLAMCLGHTTCSVRSPNGPNGYRNSYGYNNNNVYTGRSVQAELLGAVDGNTVDVLYNGSVVTVHLDGVSNDRYNEDYIYDWTLYYQFVDVEILYEEGPFEWVGYIYADGYALNDELRRGYGI